LYCVFHQTSIPPGTPPKLKEAIFMIAKLGTNFDINETPDQWSGGWI
jgi:hypothetical protein